MTSTFTVHDVQRVGRSIASIRRPSDVRGALSMLNTDPSARPIAGGTDLLLDLHRGDPGEPVTLVDLTTIDGFRSIEDAGDRWVLGGGVRHNQIVQHEGIRHSALPLAQACLEIGSPQLRNRATLAGNLVTASPANDSISALLALGATLQLSSLSGDTVSTRTVPVADFFSGFRQTVLRSGELITEIHVPKLSESQRGIWVKLGLRRAQAISVVHAGLVIDLLPGEDGPTVSTATLAVGSVAATVVIVPEFADRLQGSTLDEASIVAAATAAVDAVAPISDGRATADYRSDALRVVLERSLRTLAANEQAMMWPSVPPTLSTAEQLERTAPTSSVDIDAESTISVEINGQSCAGTHGTMVLLDWVRDVAGFTGMKEGCAEGECGACTMLVDGAAAMSCLVPAAQADGGSITTVEGLATNGEQHPIQQAFIDDFAVQCGFCIPGFLVSGARLIDEIDDPSDAQIELALSGNLCRCTGYYPIAQAVRDSAVVIRGRGDH